MGRCWFPCHDVVRKHPGSLHQFVGRVVGVGRERHRPVHVGVGFGQLQGPADGTLVIVVEKVVRFPFNPFGLKQLRLVRTRLVENTTRKKQTSFFSVGSVIEELSVLDGRSMELRTMVEKWFNLLTSAVFAERELSFLGNSSAFAQL